LLVASAAIYGAVFATEVAFVCDEEDRLQWGTTTEETCTDEPLCEVKVMLDIHMFVFGGSLRLKIGTECLEDRAEPLKFTSFEDPFGLKIGARRLEKHRVNAMNDLRVSFNE
jgi:hypothetical protein